MSQILNFMVTFAAIFLNQCACTQLHDASDERLAQQLLDTRSWMKPHNVSHGQQISVKSQRVRTNSQNYPNFHTELQNSSMAQYP